MATAPTKSKKSVEQGSPTEELERARKSTMEHLQQASAEIDEARQEATGGVRRSLDSALERLHEVSGELRRRAQDQTAEWQDALDQASDKVRQEMARRAIRAQRTPEALKALSAEIHKREADLTPPSKGAGAKG
jgi:uncharacterized FlaG/YvyC family protein